MSKLITDIDRMLRTFLFVSILVMSRIAFAESLGADASTATLTNWLIGGGIAAISMLISVVGYFLTGTLRDLKETMGNVGDRLGSLEQRFVGIERDGIHLKERVQNIERE